MKIHKHATKLIDKLWRPKKSKKISGLYRSHIHKHLKEAYETLDDEDLDPVSEMLTKNMYTEVLGEYIQTKFSDTSFVKDLTHRVKVTSVI